MSLRYKDKDGNEVMVAGGPFVNERIYYSGSFTSDTGDSFSKFSFVVPAGMTVVGSAWLNGGVTVGDAARIVINYKTPQNIDASDVVSGGVVANSYPFVSAPIAFTNTTSNPVTVYIGTQASKAFSVKVRYTIF